MLRALLLVSIALTMVGCGHQELPLSRYPNVFSVSETISVVQMRATDMGVFVVEQDSLTHTYSISHLRNAIPDNGIELQLAARVWRQSGDYQVTHSSTLVGRDGEPYLLRLRVQE